MSSINLRSIPIRAGAPSSSGAKWFIDAFTSYLDFIKCLPHIRSTQINQPPQSGWEEFSTTELVLRRLGKTDAVAALRRHMPQVDRGVPLADNSTRQVVWQDNGKDLKNLAAKDDGEIEGFLLSQSALNPPDCQLSTDEITMTFGGEEETNLIVNCATGKSACISSQFEH